MSQPLGLEQLQDIFIYLPTVQLSLEFSSSRPEPYAELLIIIILSYIMAS